MSPPGAIIVIAGPTGTGKSRLALHIASKMDAEIVSADSRQVYRYMDIGTGKPSLEERQAAPHHMLDIVDPDQPYNAGEYGRTARSVIVQILERGRLPIVAGGTGLYIRAAIDGLSPSPPSDPQIKEGLLKQAEREGLNVLYARLLQIDSPAAQRIHPNDRQRILRALEVFQITGKRLSDFCREQQPALSSRILFFFINRPRPVLFDLIDKRVDWMFGQGLIGEVEALRNKGYTPHDPGMQSLGYSLIWEFIQGNISLSEAAIQMKRDTRRYAKRQITWFRREKRAVWLDLPEKSDVLELSPLIEAHLM